LKVEEWKPIEVKQYPELKTEFALEQAKTDPEVMKYIPDHWFRPKSKIDRAFLWNILNSKQPDYTGQIVKNANNKRMVTADLVNQELTT
jgi:hypothetical protein